MIRSYNYTKRKKVPKDDISIELKAIGDKIYFTTSIDGVGKTFPVESKIYVEAYYGPEFKRFDFGSIGSPSIPKDTDVTSLTKISDRIYFRIKIVDEANGLILGYADKLNVEGEAKHNRSSIFYVNSVKMDTDEIWRMDFENDPEGYPTLELNSSIEGIQDIARSDPKFQSLVFPTAVRLVLREIVEEGDFDRDGEGWQAKWISFIEDVLGVKSTPENEPDADTLRTWFDDVVTAFCRNNRLLQQFIKTL